MQNETIAPQLEKFEQELITPERAEELLRIPGKRRPINRTYVSNYAKDMVDGTWDSSITANNTIRLSASTSHIIDGQHRLKAIVKSGKSQYFWIIRDDDDSKANRIDIGVRRTPAHMAKIAGFKKADKVVQVARILAFLCGEQSSVSLGNTLLTNILTRHPDLYKAIELYWRETAFPARFTVAFCYAINELRKQRKIFGSPLKASDVNFLLSGRLSDAQGISYEEGNPFYRLYAFFEDDNPGRFNDGIMCSFLKKAWIDANAGKEWSAIEYLDKSGFEKMFHPETSLQSRLPELDEDFLIG
ncbi:hypothetical protein NKH85_15725 [Mesorhizobium sp. M0924]|uniref:hypothetical protein n=1 Tax=unclassified Mesorhizobium TaxID=325217 RepID=UPI00333C11CD